MAKSNTTSTINTSVKGGTAMEQYKERIVAKVAELKALTEKKSGNKNPDYYKTQREFHLWTLIEGALYGNIDEALLNKLLEGGNRKTFEIHEGDNAFEIMKKYELKFEQLEKAMAANGLKLRGYTIVKA
jgi:hypothetical protein